jgi:preprotein translocase subunit YajC
MKKVLICAAFICLLATLTSSVAGAVEYGGLGGRPANPRSDNQRSESIFIYRIEPNVSVSDGIRLFNNTGETKTLTLGSVDSAPSNDGAFACSQEADPKNDVGSWIRFEVTTFTLENGQEKVIPFSLQTPDNASVGEHNGCITIQDAQQNPSRNQNGIVLTFRSAIRVAVTIPGDIVKAISFNGITINQNATQKQLYTIQPSVVNTGNVSLDTALDIKLKSVFGNTVAEKRATYPVLAASGARWSFDIERPFWGGWYRADATATYNSNLAEGIGQDSSGQKQSTSIQSQYIFIPPSPVAAVIQGVILLVALVGLFFLIHRLMERRVAARHWQIYTVNDGDTIQTIAAAHGVSWRILARVNKLKAPYTISPDSQLKVPAPKTK